MLKKSFMRGLLGLPIGVTISLLITILISFIIHDGSFYPVVPSMITSFGSELNAVVIQFILSAILGFGMGAASVIWENDNLNLVTQGILHFLISCTLMFPIAYFCEWMEHSIRGVLQYCGIFVFIYIVIWFIQYHSWKKRIDAINLSIKDTSL